MDTNFLLQFTGLCGLVPNDAGGYRIVLVNAAPLHTAAVLVQASSFDPSASTWQPHEPPFVGDANYFGASAMSTFYLDGDDLTVSTGVDIPVGQVAMPSFPCPDPTTNVHSLGWVASMTEFGAGRMSADYYSGVHPDKVLGRIDIPAGVQLATASFASNQNRKVAQFQFETGGVPFGVPRALANVISIALSVPPQIPSQPATVTLRSGARYIGLQPIQGRINAWIVNIPESDFKIGPPQPIPHELNDHFGMFYTMAVTPGNGALPRLIDDVCTPQGLLPSASSPKCPPAMFDSHA
jgi:hypothetical protein